MSPSIVHVRYCKSVYFGNLTEVDEKSFVSFKSVIRSS